MVCAAMPWPIELRGKHKLGDGISALQKDEPYGWELRGDGAVGSK